MNSNYGKKVVALALVFVAASSMFVNGQYEGTPIADYQRGGLINVPTFMTQPYFLTAKAGCPIVDRPTCGVDGKSYQNECFMKLAGIDKAYDGWCIGGNTPNPAAPAKEIDPLAENEDTGFLRFGTPFTGACPCNDIYYPVCTNKGITYGNLCRAKCNGETTIQVGQCYNFYYKPIPNNTCKCTYTKDKMCATNGVSYENSCVMTCANATFKALDVCEAPCKCPFIFKPVCGVDGRNYVNECELKCNRVQKAFAGRCEAGPIQKCIYCIGDLSRVCGKDGKNYDNLCFLKCNKAEIAYEGSCLPASPEGSCICPKIYLPVCSTDGNSFDNECSARCAGKKIAYNGACKAKAVEETHNHGQQTDLCLQNCAKHGSAPVCGTDGRTYGNECATTCNSVLIIKIATKTPCKVIVHDHCPCNTELKPVCGVDGKTYLNICTIQCVGINKAWDGACGVIGNYGYIMSQYYSGNTGAGPLTAPAAEEPKKEWFPKKHWNHKKWRREHAAPIVAIKSKSDKHSKFSKKPEKHAQSKWETRIINVTTANKSKKDAKTILLVGDTN